MRRASFLPPRKALFLALAVLASSPAFSAGTMRVEAESWLPWKFAHASVHDETGLKGEMRVKGYTWDGREETLFESRIEGWTTECELVFYLDGDLKALGFESKGLEGTKEYVVELAAGEWNRASTAPPELSRQAAMRDLAIPKASARAGFLPASLSLEGADLKGALLAVGPSILARARLAGLASIGLVLILAALALIFLDRRSKAFRFTAILLGLCLALSLGFLAFFPRDPDLVLCCLPAKDSAGRISGSMSRERTEEGGRVIIRYGEPGSGIGIAALFPMRGQGIPLGKFEAPGQSYRFSSPPRIEKIGLDFFMVTERPLMAWIIHD